MPGVARLPAQIKENHMQGNNEFHICGVEMQKAMQEWLDKRMGEYAPEVTDVSEDKGPGKTKTFIISTTEKAEEE